MRDWSFVSLAPANFAGVEPYPDYGLLYHHSCPDEGDTCLPQIPIGGGCQLNRDGAYSTPTHLELCLLTPSLHANRRMSTP